jgi:hypothetical protein
MKTPKDYKPGEAVEVAPQYLGNGRYAGETTTTMYVVGPCGSDDLQLNYRPRDTRPHCDLILHLQCIVGSGRCYWEHETAAGRARNEEWRTMANEHRGLSHPNTEFGDGPERDFDDANPYGY